MPYIDPDSADPGLVQELIKLYEQSAARLKAIVLHPPGSTDRAMQFSQARASSQLHQVTEEITRLKASASKWTGKALTAAKEKGLIVADRQIADAGLSPADAPVRGNFAQIDRHSIEVLASDTVADLHAAADGSLKLAARCLRGMADNGLSVAEVNRVIAGGIIQGKPTDTIRKLRESLRKVNGDQIEIPTKNGGTITFDTDYYARLVAVTRTREATVQGRHIRLKSRGIDLVKIIGRVSKNFCTHYLGHVYSLSGDSDRYPALADLPSGGPPFHPQCSKSTAPYIEGLSTPAKNSGDDAQSEAA